MSDATTQSPFERTARSAEAQAQRNLSMYKFKLLMFAALGYAVIFAVLFSLVAILAGLGFMAVHSTVFLIFLLKKKLILLLIPLIWVLLSALWVKLEAPQGYTVRRNEYPQLFASIDTVRRKLKAPRIHQVILTPELNAAIAQRPRLGIFGWNRNTLILGIELLLVLTPAQAEAVIAHELGHLSGNHNRFNGWIYRVRQSWHNIMLAFEQKGGFGAGLMTRFFEWYAPKFAAYSFALARANEYEADALSARTTDVQVAGDALINVHVAAPYVDEHYWRRYFKRADEIPQPEHLPWSGLGQWLASDPAAREELEERLIAVMKQETSYADTHPAIRDRLSALGADAVLPSLTSQTAAAAWLGDKYADVIADFDQDWHTQNASKWRDRFDYVTRSKKTLAELGQKPIAALTDEELWDKACLTEELVDVADARALYAQLHERNPEHAATAYALGRLTLAADDAQGLAHMKVALVRSDLTINACQFAYDFLARNDRLEEAEWWIEKANERAAIDRAAALERQELADKKDIVPIELSDDEIRHIVEGLNSSGKVKRAWLAQKRLEHYPESLALVIAVKLKGMSFSEETGVQAIQEHLSLGCDYFILPMSGAYKALAKQVVRVGQSIV